MIKASIKLNKIKLNDRREEFDGAPQVLFKASFDITNPDAQKLQFCVKLSDLLEPPST